MKYPEYEVFRHYASKKWFALVMSVPKPKLGLQEEDTLDAVNVKCDRVLIGAVHTEPGFFPAMNKESWITTALDGRVSDENINMLLELSFAAAAAKGKKKIVRYVAVQRAGLSTPYGTDRQWART